MKVGDYVRTKYGITQFKEYETTNGEKLLCMPVKDGSQGIFANIEDVVKCSSSIKNIIGLIQIGDYVNGMEVTRIGGTRWDKNDLHCYCEHNGNENWKQVMIPAKDIKSIVTKEQFSCMEYKIGE